MFKLNGCVGIYVLILKQRFYNRITLYIGFH